jgi:hypothetical protein
MGCGPGTAGATDRVRVGPGGCRGDYEMAEMSQTVMTALLHPRGPLSLIQDGADGVSPAQGSGHCSTLVDKKDKCVCSLLFQNSLLKLKTKFSSAFELKVQRKAKVRSMIGKRSLHEVLRATYSASIVDKAILVWCLLDHRIGQLANVITYPVWLCTQ